MTRFLALSFSLLLVVTGCTVQQPQQPVEPPVVIVENPVEELLANAQLAFEKNQLTTPEKSSAYRFYMDVLRIEPYNQNARLGISNIVEQYLSWALANAESGNYNRARQHLRQARSIDGSHPNIQPVLQSIEEHEQAVLTKFDLDPARVKARRVSKMVLRHIARQISPDNTFVTIQAPDDASGRWLYQELNRRVDFRIEAEFEIGRQPRIYLSH